MTTAIRHHNEAIIREFDLTRDLPAVKRIWREVGWIEDDNEEKQLDHFFGCGKTLVAELGGEAECSVHITDGTMRLDTHDLPLCAVTAVTTSRIARGHAFAQRLTARQLAMAAQDGAAVAALGMFDQGFYDKVGFGTGSYDHQFNIDPGMLRVSSAVGTPTRLSVDDYVAMHQAMTRRYLTHGSVVLQPATLFRAELGFDEKGFGLGYSGASNQSGELTHFVWLSPKGEHGPYDVRWFCYQDASQMMELLGLLKSLADQVYSISLIEPPDIQLQALLNRPFRQQFASRGSKHAVEHKSIAWWQFRVLNVAACIAALSCPLPVEFILNVTDPLAELLAPAAWEGVSGTYHVQLGQTSTASPVAAEDCADLPRLECTVNTLTRLIWGVARASSLQVTDGLVAPQALIDSLDAALCLPSPDVNWDF